MDHPLMDQQEYTYQNLSSNSPVDSGCCDVVETGGKPMAYYTATSPQGDVYLISYDNAAANSTLNCASTSSPSTPGTSSCDSGLYELSPSPPSSTAMRGGVALKRKNNEFADSAMLTNCSGEPESIKRRRAKSTGNATKEKKTPNPKMNCAQAQPNPKKSLGQHVFPSMAENGQTYLRIVHQPEMQHRPRYQSEGSRGRIKDITGKRSPAVELVNFSGRSASLQIFVGKDSDTGEPHPLFCISRCAGKGHAASVWHTFADKVVCEIPFCALDNWTLEIDCLSLVKVRNVDCPDVVDVVRKARRGAGPPRVRLVFQAVLHWHSGRTETLQVASTTIICTTGTSVPDITYISHPSCPAKEGCEIVVLGRNFIRDESKLIITEVTPGGVVLRRTPVSIHDDKFSAVHMVATIPPYPEQIEKDVSVFLNVENANDKLSDFVEFKYTPDRHLSVEPLVKSTVVGPAPLPLIKPGPSAGRTLKSLRNMDPPPTMVEKSPNRLPDICNLTSLKSAVPSPQKQQLVNFERRVYSTNNAVHYVVPIPGVEYPIIISVPQSLSIGQQRDSSVEHRSVASNCRGVSAGPAPQLDLPPGDANNTFDSLMLDILENENPAGPWYVDVDGLPMTDDVVEIAQGQTYSQ